MTERLEITNWKLALTLLAGLLCGGNLTVAAQGHPAKPAESSSPALSPDAAAFAQLNAGQVDQAAAAFQAILATQPSDAGALAGMGQVRMLQGNYLGAVSFLERARQARPDDAAIAAALDSARFSFLMGEGRDAQTAKDFEDAEKRYREALELRPGARQAVDALVNVLVLENRISDAQDALSSAVAREASATGQPPAELEMQLAQLDIANNQPQLAYPIFLQVLQDSPERVDAWSGLVSALHLMGHDADAAAQEKAIPAATRTQLQATPGFQQMMATIAAAPAPAAGAAGPSYAPFVPSETPPPAPVATAPEAPQPATAVASVPPGPRHVSSGNAASARPESAHPSVVQTVPAAKAATTPSPSRTHTEAAQATPPARSTTTAASSRSSGSGAPLVTQPASRPPVRQEEVPDTGEQQYPQPKARPRQAPPAQQ